MTNLPPLPSPFDSEYHSHSHIALTPSQLPIIFPSPPPPPPPLPLTPTILAASSSSSNRRGSSNRKPFFHHFIPSELFKNFCFAIGLTFGQNLTAQLSDLPNPENVESLLQNFDIMDVVGDTETFKNATVLNLIKILAQSQICRMIESAIFSFFGDRLGNKCCKDAIESCKRKRVNPRRDHGRITMALNMARTCLYSNVVFNFSGALVEQLVLIYGHVKKVNSDVFSGDAGSTNIEIASYKKKQYLRFVLKSVRMLSNKAFFYAYSSILSGVGGSFFPFGSAKIGMMVGMNVASLTSDAVFKTLFL